jgi:hypothetical protein
MAQKGCFTSDDDKHMQLWINNNDVLYSPIAKGEVS